MWTWRVLIVLLIIASASALEEVNPGASPVPESLERMPYAQQVADLAPMNQRAIQSFSTRSVSRRSFAVHVAQQPKRYIISLNEPQDIKQLQPLISSMDAHERSELKETIKAFSKHDVETKHDYSVFTGFSATLTEDQVEQYRQSPLVKAVEESIQFSAQLTSSRQVIDIEPLWQTQAQGTNLTGQGKSVCVIDTGINYTHPDFGSCTQAEFLAGNCSKLPAGYDFVNDDNDPVDDNGHGTHVSGTIAANNNSIGIAPGASIVTVKALDNAGNGGLDDLVAGIEYCIDNKDAYNISAISMSLGTDCDDGFCYTSACDAVGGLSAISAAVNNATANNISVIAAAGNDANTTHINIPSCLANATAVAASTDADAVASFSNRNSLVSLIAPGVSITATCYNQLSCTKQGTSMATPHVSALYAIVDQFYTLTSAPKTPAEIFTIINSSATTITDGSSGLNFSRINASAVASTFGDTTAPTTTATYDSSWQNSNVTVTLNATDDIQVNYTTYRIGNASPVNGTAFNVSQEGNTTVRFYSVDNSSNKEDNNTVYVLIDYTNPNTTLNASAIWYQNVNFSFETTDNLSGVDYTNFTLNETNYTSDTLNFTTQGWFTITYFSVDNAGNIENASNLSLGLDYSDPVLNISANTSWQRTDNYTINVSATDNFSSILALRINNTNTNTTTFTGQGNFTVEVYAADGAGNEVRQNVSVLLDDVAPNTTANSSSAYSAPVNMTFASADATSGVSYTRIQTVKDSGNQTNSTLFPDENQTVAISLVQDGNYSINYSSTDVAGNQESANTLTVLIDTTQPQILSIALNDSQPQPGQEINITAAINETYPAGANITIGNTTAAMNRSESTYWYEYTTLSAGNYEISVTVADQLANTASSTKNFTVYERVRQTNITVNDTTIQTRNQTNTTLRLKTNVSVSGNVTVLKSVQRPAGVNRTLSGALKHATVQLSQSIADSLQWANLSMHYSDDEIDGLNESTMRMHYYNESANDWVQLSASLDFVNEVGHDLQNNVVWANVTHFSTYAISGNQTQESEPEDDSSGSGGSGGGGSSSGGGGGFASSLGSANTTTLSLRYLAAANPINRSVNIANLSLTQISLVPTQDYVLQAITITRHEIPSAAPADTIEYFTITHDKSFSFTDAQLTIESDEQVSLLHEGSGWRSLDVLNEAPGSFVFSTQALGGFALVREESRSEQPSGSVQQEERPQEQEPAAPDTDDIAERGAEPLQQPVSLRRDGAQMLFLVLGVIAVIGMIAAHIDRRRTH